MTLRSIHEEVREHYAAAARTAAQGSCSCSDPKIDRGVPLLGAGARRAA